MNILRKTSTAVMSLSNKSLLCSALAVSLVATSTTPATAVPSSVNVSGKTSVQFVVTNIPKAAGWGAHFSTTASTDGYGGTDAECHLNSGTNTQPAATVTLLCYDGYKDAQNAQNQFRLDLGPKKENNKDVLTKVTITVTAQAVKVKAYRIATNPYTNEQKPYTISSSFPLRQTTGFFKTGKIYYQANGVLNGDTTRQGMNYVLATPVVR
ncbi:MAG TPA: hypothetical protein V6D48_05575 [Oculatellaceae cyanobacterium]